MAWNVFKLCTALRGLGSAMIVLVLGVVGVTYYALVVINYGPSLFHGGLETFVALAVLLLFHSLLVMLLWSYFSVVSTDPGGVPPNWKPEVDEEKGDADPLLGSEQTGVALGVEQANRFSNSATEAVRFCRKCNQFKPPRCHHCSVCGRCILKMDHHCVWVVNCVGAKNYKYFLLFLFYTFLETALVTLSLLPYFIAFFSDQEIPGTPGPVAATFLTFVEVLANFSFIKFVAMFLTHRFFPLICSVLNLAFALSVLGFLIMHISLVAANTTTIEAFEKKRTTKWRYDIGRKKNFEQVFGTDKRFWLIPAYSEEDIRQMPELQGLEYPSKPNFQGLQEL